MACGTIRENPLTSRPVIPLRETWLRIPSGWRPLVAAWLIVTLALCVYTPIRAENGTDFRDFWRTAKHFRETGELSSELGVHNYLPAFTIFMQAWSFLPLPAAIVVWTIASSLAWGMAVLLTEIVLNDGLAPRPRPPTYLALLLMLPYAIDCGVLGQLALFLTFLVVLAWFLAIRGEEWFAAIALALAAVVKLMPVALLPFFLIRGRWRMTAATVGFAVLLGWGAPLAVIGHSRTVAEHAAYRARAVEGHSAHATIYAEKPIKSKYSNNALPIVLRRWLTPVDYDPQPEKPPTRMNVANLPRGAVWWIYAVTMALLVTISIAAVVRSPARWPPQSLEQLRSLHAQFGAWCCMMLLATPLLWTHYLPLVYWPLAFLADRAGKQRAALGRPDRFTEAMLWVWLIAIVALAWPLARAAGAQWLAVLAMWAGCVRWSLGAPDPSDSDPKRFQKKAEFELRGEGLGALR